MQPFTKIIAVMNEGGIDSRKLVSCLNTSSGEELVIRHSFTPLAATVLHSLPGSTVQPEESRELATGE